MTAYERGGIFGGMYEEYFSRIKKVIVTGGTGCVGHYVVEGLLDACPWITAYILTRDPDNWKLENSYWGRMKFLVGSMETVDDFKDEIEAAQGIIHIGTEWGEYPHTMHVNVQKVLDMLDYVDEENMQRILIFSTASLLGDGNQVLDEAYRLGSAYIVSKYLALKKLKDHRYCKELGRMRFLFPTTVWGGDKHRPMSHMSKAVQEMKEWTWLLRWISVDASFHYIHGFDIAEYVTAFFKAGKLPDEEDIVLGHDVIHMDRVLRDICTLHGVRVYRQFRIPKWFVTLILRLFKRKMTRWDWFCFQKPHFVYRTRKPEHYGRFSRFSRFLDCINPEKDGNHLPRYELDHHGPPELEMYWHKRY